MGNIFSCFIFAPNGVQFKGKKVIANLSLGFIKAAP